MSAFTANLKSLPKVSHIESITLSDAEGNQVSMQVEIPTIRCTVPLREQAGVAADPQVMRTVSREGDRCFGVYADIGATGTLRVGDEGSRAVGGVNIAAI